MQNYYAFFFSLGERKRIQRTGLGGRVQLLRISGVTQETVKNVLSANVLVVLHQSWEFRFLGPDEKLMVDFALVLAHPFPPRHVVPLLLNLVLQLGLQHQPIPLSSLLGPLLLFSQLLLNATDLDLLLLQVSLVHLFPPHLLLQKVHFVEVACLYRLEVLLLPHSLLRVILHSGVLQFMEKILFLFFFALVYLLDYLVGLGILAVPESDLVYVLCYV